MGAMTCIANLRPRTADGVNRVRMRATGLWRCCEDQDNGGGGGVCMSQSGTCQTRNFAVEGITICG